jgi:hypothetical protein
MKTTAEAADVILLGASFPSLAMGMGDGRARCFRQGLPCPANPKGPDITPEAFSFLLTTRANSEADSSMRIFHDLYDNDSLDYSMITAYSIYQAVGRSDRTP